MWANEVEAFLMQIVSNIEPERKTVVTSHAAELDQLLAKISVGIPSSYDLTSSAIP